MELKNIFKMTKTDRYTQDGRDELAKLQETEDVKYKTGDISQKTGLQKQPDGSWAPPKKGGKPAGKNGPSRMEKEEAIRKDLGLRGENDLDRFSDEQIEMMYQKSQRTPEQQKADFNNSKIGQAVNKGRQEFATEKARQKELASKTNAIGLPKENSIKSQEKKNWEDFFSETDKKIAAAGNAEKLPEAKFDEYGLPDDETIAMKDLFLQKENITDPNKLTNTEFNALAKKLDSELGIGNMERAQELLVTPRESKSAEKDIRSEFNITREEHDMDVRESNAKIYPELQPLVKQRKAFFQKQVEAYTKLRDNPNNPKARADFVDAKNAISQIDADIDRAYKKATGDSAPRQLTGDCRIRIRKEKPKLTGDTKIRVKK